MDKCSPAEDYSKTGVIVAGIKIGSESLMKPCRCRDSLERQRPAKVSFVFLLNKRSLATLSHA